MIVMVVAEEAQLWRYVFFVGEIDAAGRNVPQICILLLLYYLYLYIQNNYVRAPISYNII